MKKSTPQSPLKKVQTDYLLECLWNLPDTGSSGFEGLIRDLMEQWTKLSFRLARTGSQFGKDATSDISKNFSVAFEAKRYQETSSLKARDLAGELLQAKRTLPDLDLWILAATKEVGDLAKDLRDQAELIDLDIFILDSRKEKIGPLQVFCAKFPDSTVNFCQRNGNNVDTKKLRAHLRKIQKNPAYDKSVEVLRDTVDATIFGLATARERAFNWLLAQVANSNQAQSGFSQDIGLNQKHRVTRKTLNQQFDIWWQARKSDSSCCVLLGEEGTGKTWATIAWLVEAFEQAACSIVLPVTTAQLPESADLAEIIVSALKKRCGKTEDYWKKRLDGWLKRPQSEEPLFLLCLDGLNEKPNYGWKKVLAESITDEWLGRVAILMTCHPDVWRKRVSSGKSTETVIKTDGYDDNELRQVLVTAGITLEQVEKELRPLIRKPRYCDIVIERFSAMVASGDMTVERLLYIDRKDKEERKLNQPITDDHFREILGKLAKQYLAGVRSFGQTDLKPFLPDADPYGTFLQDIIDGGLLVSTGLDSAPFKVERRRLIHGLGMLLAEHLKGQESHTIDELVDVIGIWLEPEKEMEMKPSIVGAAVFFSLIGALYPVNARRALLRYWIGTRNMSEEQERAICAYLPDCPEDVLAIADDYWRYGNNNGLAQGRLAQAMLQRRDDPRVKPALVRASIRWMSYVNIKGHLFERGTEDKHLNALSQAINERFAQNMTVGENAKFHNRLFQIIDDDGLMRLARFALLIISGGDRVSFVEAFLQWAFSRRLTGRDSESDEAAWTLRLTDEELWPIYAPTLESMVVSEDETVRKAAHLLLCCLGTTESLALKEKYLANLYPPNEWQIAHKKDPCTSMFSLRREDYIVCMSRDDLEVNHIVRNMDDFLSDPAINAPESFVARLNDSVQMLPVKCYRAKFCNTVEDHTIEQFEPVLARFAPKLLGDIMRSAIRSIQERDEEGVRQLLIHAPELAIILQEREMEILHEVLMGYGAKAAEWTEDSPDTLIERDKLAEAEGVLALAFHLTPDEVAGIILQRPTKAFDLIQLQHWFAVLSEQSTQSYLDSLLSENDTKRFTRLLWLLCYAKPSLSEAHRQRIIEFIDSTDAALKGVAFQFAWMSADQVLLDHILQIECHYLHPEKLWSEAWHSDILCQYGNDLPFDTLIRRLPLAKLGWAVFRRGCRADDLSTYAEFLDAVWQRIAEKFALTAPPSIAVRVSTSKDAGALFTSYSESSSDKSIHYRSPDTVWGSGSPNPDADMKKLFTRESDDQYMARQRAFHERISELTRSEETRWHLDQFNVGVLEHICRSYPEKALHWINSVLEGDTARSMIAWCEGFYQSLCSAFVNVEPSLGFALWRRIRRGSTNVRIMDSTAGTDWMTCLPFSANVSQEAEEARCELLDSCTSDADLMELANAACAHGQHSWVLEQARILIDAPQLWRRAKGIMLLCLADADFSTVSIIQQANVDGTWVEPLLTRITYYHERNLWARHWYQCFLVASSNDKAFAAYKIFLTCADRRCRIWVDTLENQAKSDVNYDPRRIKFCLTNYQQLNRAIEENEKNLKDHFFTLKFNKGQLMPFV